MNAVTRLDLRAFGGLPLEGSAPVRYIYVNEAGTSAKEPVTVVVGVIIDADRHWMAMASQINELFDQYVPAHLRSGFIFHATDVLSGRDERWTKAARIKLVKKMARIPYNSQCGLAFAVVYRAADIPSPLPTMSKEDWHYTSAFALCALQADQYMKAIASPKEVANLTAEDNPRMRKHLSHAHQTMQQNGLRAQLAYTLVDQFGPRPEKEVIDAASLRITRIMDSAKFDSKTGAPILQVADACAFSIRRRLAKQRYGSELVRAMCGFGRFDELKWDSDACTGYFSF